MKITVVEAPNHINANPGTSLFFKPSVFLAGGISSCPDWQKDVIESLSNDDIIIYNPRRENFDIKDPNATHEQISWEYNYLKKSDIIAFWFSAGSLNPIVLYELGRWGNSSDRSIVVGVDPEYQRIEDVVIQTKLSRPDVLIHRSLDSFIEGIKKESQKLETHYILK